MSDEMPKLERYGGILADNDDGLEMGPRVDGEYVKLADVQALLLPLQQAVARLDAAWEADDGEKGGVPRRGMMPNSAPRVDDQVDKLARLVNIACVMIAILCVLIVARTVLLVVYGR